MDSKSFEQFSVSITQGSILWNLVKTGLVVYEEMLFKGIVDGAKDRRMTTKMTTDGEWPQ